MRPFFPLNKTLDYLFTLSSKLFGVRIEKIEDPGELKAELWHPDVQLFKVSTEEGEIKAYFYLDPFARAGSKGQGAWMQEVQNYSTNPLFGKHTPVSLIVLNSRPPTKDVPSLLQPDDVLIIIFKR